MTPHPRDDYAGAELALRRRLRALADGSPAAPSDASHSTLATLLPSPATDASGTSASGGEPDLADRALRLARLRSRRRVGGALTAAAATVVVVLGVGAVSTWVASGRAPAAAGSSSSARAATAAQPWAGRSRVNLLLIGSDEGADRTGIRPDSIDVASIDVATGDTLLIGLPRALQWVPFPPAVAGSGTAVRACQPDPQAGSPAHCQLADRWAFGQENPQLYPGAEQPGLAAVRAGVEQVTGLAIDEDVTVTMRGLMELVDALGGVTVTVPQRLPVGGDTEIRQATSWLEAGRQHLDGYHALWFARSRWSTSDTSRMARQRCLIRAVVDQADLTTVATRLPQLSAALKDTIRTSIPLSRFGDWLALLGRVQHASVRSLPLTPEGPLHVDLANPDYPGVRAGIAAGIAAALDPMASPSSTPESGPGPTVRAPAGTADAAC